MKKFLIISFLFLFPLYFLVFVYVIIDPYKVIYHHAPFYETRNNFTIHRGYVSTMTFKEQIEKYGYNSYIFGNSRSLFYEVETWQKYLPLNSSCYHFDESGGCVRGLYEKVEYINKHHADLDYALIVLDEELLSFYERTGPLFMPIPELKTGFRLFQQLSFHFKYFSCFIKPKIFVAILDYSIFRTYRSYMKSIIDPLEISYDIKSNEIRLVEIESKIDNGNYYTDEKMSVFNHAQFPSDSCTCHLDEEKVILLKNIKDIFDSKRTSFKVVISPLYDQKKMNIQTVLTLQSIFGEANVYDFSGINKWNQDYRNYYEASHYRPQVAAEIMSIIYNKNNSD